MTTPKRTLVFSLLFCAALFLAGSTRGPAQTVPTFDREVVRIFQTSCQNCHRAGAIAPFALMTYKDAKPLAALIKKSVEIRDMPPWKPSVGCGDFRDSRALSQADIDTISNWVTAGAPEGNAADLPAPVTFPTDWSLGQPDRVLSSSEPFTAPGNGGDIYRCFSIPAVSASDQFISGFDYKPDRASIVHHVVLYADPSGASANMPSDGKGPGYTCFGGAEVDGAKILSAWAPGSTPHFAPEGVASLLPAGSRIVMQVHYHPNGVTQTDQTRFGLYFAKGPVSHDLRIAAVGSSDFVIPAGNANFTLNARLAVNQPIQIIQVFPHMHLVGRKMKLEATLPDHSQQCMFDIQDWDFHWQGFYLYKKAIPIPAGTVLTLDGVYDNSTANPDQPNHPPVEVRYGEGTTDEMFLGIFGYISDVPLAMDSLQGG